MRCTPDKRSGFTLIELLVGMSILAFVLSIIVHVLVQTATVESLASAQMHGLDLARRSASEHHAGVALAANSTVVGEGGMRLLLSATESTNTSLGLHSRTQSVLAIDDKGNASEQVFLGSVRLTPRPYVASQPLEDLSTTSGPSLQQITLKTGSPTGNVYGQGAYPHGTLASIRATPLPGNHFVRWTGSAVTNSSNAQTFILANDDKEVTAVFDVGDGVAGGILFTPMDLGQPDWASVFAVTSGGTGAFTYAGHNYQIRQVSSGFSQSWGATFVTANLYLETTAKGTDFWPRVGIFSTSDSITNPTINSMTAVLAATNPTVPYYAPYQAVVGPTVYQIDRPPAGASPRVIVTLPAGAPSYGSCSGWLVMQLN